MSVSTPDTCAVGVVIPRIGACAVMVPESTSPSSLEPALTLAEAERTRVVQWLKAKALTLGFSHVALVSPKVLEAGGKVLDQWIAEGHHADMDWMERNRPLRVEPGKILPGTQTIVVVTMNYFSPDEGSDVPDAGPSRAAGETGGTGETRVSVARYARGTDYHRLIKRKLKTLAHGLSQQLQALGIEEDQWQYRPLTDSAPVLERALATEAGLGWVGKHGNLIMPGAGSWFFIGELLLTLPLADNEIALVPDMCGRCQACVTACPTDALLPNRTVDSNRCIAYWTIEYREEAIPPPMDSQLNGWVFGCDICQEVCPWNVKFAIPTEVEELHPRSHNQHSTAEWILSLTEEDFQHYYRQSPVKRTGLKNLQRNARAILKVADTVTESE